MNLPYLSFELADQFEVLDYPMFYFGWVFAKHAFGFAIELARVELINIHVAPEADSLVFLPIITSVADRDDLGVVALVRVDFGFGFEFGVVLLLLVVGWALDDVVGMAIDFLFVEDAE